MPDTEEDEELSHNHTQMAAFALGLGLQDQRMIDVLTELIEEKVQESAARKAGGLRTKHP